MFELPPFDSLTLSLGFPNYLGKVSFIKKEKKRLGQIFFSNIFHNLLDKVYLK